MKRILAIILMIFSVSIYAKGNSSDIGGPPKLNEIIGFWQKIEHPNEKKVNKVNPWPLKYQWFGFYKNGKVYSMMTSEDTTYTAKELDEIFKSLPEERVPNYKLNGQFIYIDNKEIKNYLEVWGINLLRKNASATLKKGMLIMTLDDGKGNVIYYRILKKVK